MSIAKKFFPQLVKTPEALLRRSLGSYCHDHSWWPDPATGLSDPAGRSATSNTAWSGLPAASVWVTVTPGRDPSGTMDHSVPSA
jgi:hypothetical protein